MLQLTSSASVHSIAEIASKWLVNPALEPPNANAHERRGEQEEDARFNGLECPKALGWLVNAEHAIAVIG